MVNITPIEGHNMRCSCYFLAIGIACLSPQWSLGQPNSNQAGLARILSDWKDRQLSLKTARYVISGTMEFKDKELPTGSPVRPERFVFILDFEHKRWRLESSADVINYNGGRGLTFTTRTGTSAYDGSDRQAYYHRKANGLDEDGPDLGIDKGQRSQGNSFGPELWPVCFAHGFIPTSRHELGFDLVPIDYDSDDFEMRGQLNFHGRNCAVVRTLAMPFQQPAFEEIWIDPRQKSAIHRYVTFTGSNPFARIDVDWKKTSSGWWPERWTSTYSLAGKVWRIHRLHVESFESDPAVSDSDFKLEAKPGMKVLVADQPPPGPGLNPNLPATRTYLVSSSGSWEEVAAKGYTTVEGLVLPPDQGLAWLWWVGGATAAFASTIALMYYVLHRKWKSVAAQD